MLDPYVISTLRVNIHFAQGLLADLPDDGMTTQPIPGTTLNHAAWVLGHLTIGNAYALSLIGESFDVPQEWNDRFGMDSTPDGGPYPAKADLLDAYVRSSEQLIEALGRVTPDQLARPMDGMLAGYFPTVGDFVVFDITAHHGTHLGQLSAWRRALGFKRLF